MRIQSKQISYVLGAMLVGSLVTGVVMSLPSGIRSDVYADQQARAEIAAANLSTAQGMSTAFRNVAEAMRPSVVSINTISTRQVTTRGRRNLPQGLGGIPPWMLDDFFEGSQSQSPQSRRETGMGSGVIVSTDGYILTNNHVVENADELEVELSDGSTVPGKIVGTDPETDLAVVKIDRSGLQAVRFGSSDAIRVGDWVLAIGSPFGLDQTVTAGIISGKNRVQAIVNDGDGYEDFLQTDAAINPGNSGGPLVNLRGELVGINTAIMSRSGSSAGIGFAIPVSLARPVLDSIVSTGQVRRGFFGASVGDVTPEVEKQFDLKVSQGALISSVLEDKPAALAGVQPGDVVTKIDDKKIKTGTQLRNYVASRPPGSKITVTVDRDGKSMTLDVDLQERTNDAMAMFEDGGAFGAEFTPVTPETAAQYNYRGLTRGLIVTKVEDGSLAAQGSLKVGDVIESAGGIEVNSVDDLTKIFAEAKKQKVPLRVVVRRGNSRMLLVLQ